MDPLTNEDIQIILVLAGLSFCICFGVSSPSLFMNDEWITTNQLNQLFSGEQLIESEGKYGRLFTGETGAYFTTRDNYLAYSLMLPVLAIPSLFVIVSVGDIFRLLLLSIWFLIGAGSLLSLAGYAFRHGHARTGYLSLTALSAFFIVFLINLYYYQPFESGWADSPVESAALILTNTIMFSLMPPMIYVVFRYVGLSRMVSLIGACITISCSSYLYWAGSAKDHLLVAFLVTLLVFLFARSQHEHTPINTFSLFIVGGLLCWARPEFGIIILFGMIIWEIVSLYVRKGDSRQGFLAILRERELYVSLSGAGTGLIPFILNNLLITKNPFIPPQYLYIVNSRTQIPSAVQNVHSGQAHLLPDVSIYLNQIINFYSPDFDRILPDLYHLFWLSPNGSLGILFVCPIIFPALLYGMRTINNIRQNFPKERVNMLIFCLFLIFLTFLAYARVIHGSTISQGSLPDMRYFSPLYLPMGIVSVILVSPLISIHQNRWLVYSLSSIFLFSPLIILGFSLIQGGFNLYLYISLMAKVLLVLYLLIPLFALIFPDFWSSRRIFPAICATMLVIPSSIQVLLIIFYAHVKMNGYPFWQPVLQYLFTYVIQIIT